MNRWWLTSDRWFVAGVIALLAAVVALIGRAWPEAALFFAATIVLLAVGLGARGKADQDVSATDRRRVRDGGRREPDAVGIRDIRAIPPNYVNEYDEGRPRR